MLTEENKHMLFKSKRKIHRRHSADSAHEDQNSEEIKALTNNGKLFSNTQKNISSSASSAGTCAELLDNDGCTHVKHRKTQLDAPHSSQKAHIAAATAAKASESETKKLGRNNFMLQSVYDCPNEYCAFLKYLYKSYSDLAEAIRILEPIGKGLMKISGVQQILENLKSIESGSLHKTIFYSEIWNDQIIAVFL